MSEPAEREAMLREIAKKKVVYVLPGMEAVPAHRDLTFRSASGGELLMDVYYPPQPPEGPLPLVLMAMAYPDPTARVRLYGPVTSWAQLFAASGMAAVVYGTEEPAEDVHALLRHLRAEAADLRLDVDRFGLFATSANVTVGLSTLIRDGRLRCGALLYGYTVDVAGSTTIADMARQTGFVNACAGASIDDLPADVSILFVRAGRDHFPGLTAARANVVQQSLARNLPVWLINHAAGAHGFDLDEQSATSRGVVQQVLAFLRLHLMV